MEMKKFLYGTMALLGLGLTACSSDDNPIPGNGKTEDAEVRFMRVAIANPPSTRAAEFIDGTEAENTVKNMYFKFYDAAGNPIDGEQTILDIEEDPIPFDEFDPANSSVGKVKDVVVQISLPRGANYPSYVVCFINPVKYAEIDDESSMNDLRNQTRDSYKANDGTFAMNNSVYYGNDPISGAQQVKMLGAPISDGQLFTSREAAETATGDAIVDIYVERYAAKVNFTLAQTDEAIKPITQGLYTLTFVPEAWTINADAPNMYASKRFESTITTDHLIPTYTDVQTMLGGWQSWNDEPNHRSYWACSPGYYADKFPQVSDDIIDYVKENPLTGANAGNLTGAGVAVGDFALRYYSYNQIKGTTGSGAGVTAFNNGGNNFKYVMENTMGTPAFKSLNPKAAAPSVILVGHYDVSVTGGDGTILEPGDGFCIYGGQIYFRNNIPTGAAVGASTMRTKFLNENNVLAINEGGTLLTNGNATEAIRNLFEVAHPSKEVRGTQPIPHRYVTLQIKEDVTPTGLYYKPIGSDEWTAVTTADITYVNTLLWQQLGNASSYTQNKCYFSIPIQHLGMTENTIDTNPIVDGELDWSLVRVGDFGLVRNHVYDLRVSEINGRASGIEDLTNPLVPSMDETNYWIKYRVNILNWRVVPAQNNIILK